MNSQIFEGRSHNGGARAARRRPARRRAAQRVAHIPQQKARAAITSNAASGRASPEKERFSGAGVYGGGEDGGLIQGSKPSRHGDRRCVNINWIYLHYLCLLDVAWRVQNIQSAFSELS